MSRRAVGRALLGDLVLVAAVLAATVYILVATVQSPDAPSAVNAAKLGAVTLLAFAAFVVLLALYVAARLWIAPWLTRWHQQRTVRRQVRRRDRRIVRERRDRHRSRIGGVR